MGEKERNKEKKNWKETERERTFSSLFVTSTFTDRKPAGISSVFLFNIRPITVPFLLPPDKIDVIAVWWPKLGELGGIRSTEGTTTAHRYQWAVTLIKLNLETASLSHWIQYHRASWQLLRTTSAVPERCGVLLSMLRHREREREGGGGGRERVAQREAHTYGSKFKIPRRNRVVSSSRRLEANKRVKASKRDQLFLSNERFTNRVMGNCDELSRCEKPLWSYFFFFFILRRFSNARKGERGIFVTIMLSLCAFLK